jgi:sugar lactone lactonase YvrE
MAENFTFPQIFINSSLKKSLKNLIFILICSIIFSTIITAKANHVFKIDDNHNYSGSLKCEIFLKILGNRSFGLTNDNNGNIYFTTGDGSGNGVLNKISPVGSISTIASFKGSFIGPGLAVDKDGFFIIPIGNNVIKVSTEGEVTTLFSTEALGIKRAINLVLDNKNNIYIIDDIASKVYKVDSLFNTSIFIDNPSSIEKPFSLMDMNFDKDYKNVYLAESERGRILKYSLNEDGLPDKMEILYENNSSGILSNITIDEDGSIYIVPYNGNRLITIKDKEVMEFELTGTSGVLNAFVKNNNGRNILFISGSGGIFTVNLSSTTSAGEKNGMLKDYQLYQNYPNPFNPSTLISYQIPVDASVDLKVYNSLGAEVSTLVNQKQTAGIYNVIFDGSNLASGIYFYRIRAGEFSNTKKLILMK